MRKDHPPHRHHCRTLDDLRPLVEQLGHRVSAGSWEDDRHACAFSVATWGPATYNHPRVTVQLDKKTGWLSVTS